MKWIVVQLVESEESPELEEGQTGMCCRVREVEDQSGYELLNFVEE